MKMLIDEKNSSLNKAFIIKFFGILALILLVFSLVRDLSSNFNTAITISSFLEYASNAPTITPIFTISDFSIVGDWGLFDFFRDFLNLFTGIFGFVTWLTAILIGVARYLFYFLRFLFL